MKNFLLTGFTALIFLFLLFSSDVRANFIAGGSINYTSLGNNQYVVNVELIRDCAGSSAPVSDTLTVSSFSCAYSQKFPMVNIPGGPGFSVCPHMLNTCIGGTSPGFQQWDYTVVITLPAQCSDWVFSVSECCRAAGITTIQNPGTENFYLDAGLDNTVQENQSTSIVNLFFTACIGQANFFNLGAIDADGDSLSFALINAKTSENNSVNYKPGFSGTVPVTSVPALTIDPVTGVIDLYGTDSSEYGVIAVQINEFRGGNLVGYTTANYPILFVNCMNSLPALNGPVISNFPATQQSCINIFSFDSDLNDTLAMTWNNGIPGASFTVTGSPYPVGQFCWTPSISDISPQPYTFVVSVTDNACPVSGITSFSYQVFVTQFTGIDAIEINNDLHLFPNPTTGKVEISSPANIRFARISVMDVLGNVVLIKNLQSEFDIADFKNGIYFIKAEVEDGNFFLGKVLKE